MDYEKRLFEDLRAIPGVDSVAFADSLPYEGRAEEYVFNLKDRTASPNAAQPHANLVSISLDYFKTLRIPLIEGRLFRETDKIGEVYVVDQRFAKRYFPGRSAVGGHFTFQDRNLLAKEDDWPTVIGVVRSVPHDGAEDGASYVYALMDSRYIQWYSAQSGGLNLLLRSSRPAADLIPVVRDKLKAVDLSVPLFRVGRLENTIDQSYDRRRGIMLALGGFALLAAFLASIGTYSVLAFDVARRTREIGIRSALGATRERIMALIWLKGIRSFLAGATVGLAGAAILGCFMAGMLFGLEAFDPLTYGLATLVLGLVAGLACYLPARQSTQIDPLTALRSE